MKPVQMKKGYDSSKEILRLIRSVNEHWLLSIRESNPAILEIFRDRDIKPYRDLLPWSGEFIGKTLTGAHTVYRLIRDDRLREYVTGLLDELIGYIDPDTGYLGCFPTHTGLTGLFTDHPEGPLYTWDAWNHYHCMMGLYLWALELDSPKYLGAVESVARGFLPRFYGDRPTLASIGYTEMNLAPIHIFALLHQTTGKTEYLDFALRILADLESEDAGNYFLDALRGVPFYRSTKPRWESMHIIMGIAELYGCTGDGRYLRAALGIFDSILSTDVHNTGGFSTNEMAVGNPYEDGAIELCCVVAFNALAATLYRYTGKARIANFLEYSLYNAVMGSFSPSGRWSTYNTPMDGIRIANTQQIVFQSRPGSPFLNCCSVNAARGLGMLSDWAFMEEEGRLVVNWYEAGRIETASGVALTVTGEYPALPQVHMEVKCTAPVKMDLRIPDWSETTVVRYGDNEYRPSPDSYLRLDIPAGAAEVHILFDFTPRVFTGDGEKTGKKSVAIGPLLFGCDIFSNPKIALDRLPPVSLRSLADTDPVIGPGRRVEYHLENGLILKDFYHLGESGCPYRTWLNVVP